MSTRIPVHGGLKEITRYFTQQDEMRSEFFACCRNGDLQDAKKIFRINPSCLNFTTRDDKTPLQVALLSEQFDIASWISRKDSSAIAELKEDKWFCFSLVSSKKIASILWLISIDETFTKMVYINGKPLGFAICETLDQDFIDQVYAADPKIIQQTYLSQTVLSLFCENEHRGYPGLSWLIEKSQYQLKSTSDGYSLVDYARRFPFFNQKFFLSFFKSQSVYYLFPYFNELSELIRDESVAQAFTEVSQKYSKKIIFSEEETKKLEGDELVSFYDSSIPDLPEIQNPFKKLLHLFFLIKKVSYAASFAEQESHPRKVWHQRKIQEIKKCKDLFSAIRNLKPDESVPIGKEFLYYRYLQKILKHLSVYLEKKEHLDERIIFLRDLSEASGHCYTHFGTIIRSIYTRIKGCEEFYEVEQASENLGVIFLSDLKKHLKRQMIREIQRTIGDQNVHVFFIIQKIFSDLSIPFFMETIVDHEVHLTASLLYMRQTLLDIPFEATGDLAYDESELYQDTKAKFVEKFLHHLQNPFFLFKEIAVFLDDHLKKEGHEKFLASLLAFLESEQIPSHKVLSYSDEGGIELKRKGLLKILAKLPSELIL